MRPETIGWLVGYFVVFAPIQYAFNGSLIYGLLHSIIGMSGAIVVEVVLK